MMLLRSRALRLPVVALAALSWLSLTSHCAIAALESSAKSPPIPSCHEAPMDQHAPAKDKRCDLECCRMFPATPVKGAEKITASYDTHFVAVTYLLTDLALTDFFRASLPLEWDTGPPPFVASFAESVLQRSIFAHAPPFST